MLLVTIPDQYPKYYKALESCTGYFDSLDIMILLSYPSSIVITRDYCTSKYLVCAATCTQDINYYRTPTVPVLLPILVGAFSIPIGKWAS